MCFFLSTKDKKLKGFLENNFSFLHLFFLAKENYIGPETFFYLRQVSSHWNGMKYAEVLL